MYRSGALVLSLLVAACAGGGVAVPPGTTPASPRSTTRPIPARPAAPRPAPRPAPQVQVAPGLEGIIGADTAQLSRLFGTPRLDIREDDARKLQWSGEACILDAFLYPARPGAAPTATYVETRRGDGRDTDRAACIAALRKPGAR